MSNPDHPVPYVRAIRERDLTIYDPIGFGDPDLWIPTTELESLLDDGLAGISLAGLPLRTRSKVVKERICQILGYPIPSSFKKTQPRFLGQFFDVYVQKSNNLQIWNEELAASRRYVLIRVDAQDYIVRVKVVTGAALAVLDTTGTLTQKYQARLVAGGSPTELITGEDTEQLRQFVVPNVDLSGIANPSAHPAVGWLLPIAEVFDRLLPLLDSTFAYAGHDQERSRGAELHRLVCHLLGYADYHDDGRYPDVRHQLLEVKLQTSPTIDLGLVSPDSTEGLDVPYLNGYLVRHCDVRYALFYATTDGEKIRLTHLFATTGERFFTRFPRFQGKVLNKKLQIPLPSGFFDR